MPYSLFIDTWIASPLLLLCCWVCMCRYLTKVLFPVSPVKIIRQQISLFVCFKEPSYFIHSSFYFSNNIPTSCAQRLFFSVASLALCRVLGAEYLFFVVAILIYWRDCIFSGLWIISRHEATSKQTEENVKEQFVSKSF